VTKVRWREAMARALYGPGGFFTRPGPGPAAHFRTSVHASPLFAGAVNRLLVSVDNALGNPDPIDVVDVGAGRGELLRTLARIADPALAARLRLTAVELAPRPPDLPGEIRWMDRPPAGSTGLLVATEWLDNVPVDLAVGNPPRYLHVNGRPGGQVTRLDESWLRTWWPQSDVEGARAEIGLTRDRAWASVVSCIERGLALAVDYGHLRDARPVFGTLAGHRHGRRVDPVPDGSCDITAYVAIDSVAAAGAAVAGSESIVVSQRTALRALGVHGRRPPDSLAREDPVGYINALAKATAAAELTDPVGLGGHWWLLQPVGILVIPEVISLA
jgi:SAM-dependent MidA family methyltransferase